MNQKTDATGEPVYTLDNRPPQLTSAELVEAGRQRMRASPHCQVRMLERAPIRLYGIGVTFGSIWFLYRDAEGNRRVFSPQQHDQAGIASLFRGAEGWLCRLWPAPDGGWDYERAQEMLIAFSDRIGTVHAEALGFELPPSRPPWA
jgi:hypothetical protein